MFNKKGVSDVITTVLIILLVLAAVVIVWAFVFPLITAPTEDVTTECFKVNLDVESCSVAGAGTAAQTATVRVNRGAGAGDLRELRVIFSGSTGTVTATNNTAVPGILEGRTYSNLPASGTAIGNLQGGTARVAAVVGPNLVVCETVSQPVTCS